MKNVTLPKRHRIFYSYARESIQNTRRTLIQIKIQRQINEKIYGGVYGLRLIRINICLR